MYYAFRDKSKEIARLAIGEDDKLTFNGDLDESAKILFEEVCKLHESKVKQLEAEIHALKQRLKGNVAYAENK